MGLWSLARRKFARARGTATPDSPELVVLLEESVTFTARYLQQAAEHTFRYRGESRQRRYDLDVRGGFRKQLGISRNQHADIVPRPQGARKRGADIAQSADLGEIGNFRCYKQYAARRRPRHRARNTLPVMTAIGRSFPVRERKVWHALSAKQQSRTDQQLSRVCYAARARKWSVVSNS